MKKTITVVADRELKPITPKFSNNLPLVLEKM